MVGVVDFGAFDLSLADVSPLQKIIANMITTELAEHSTVRLVDRSRIEEVLDRLNITVGASGVSNEDAARIGRMISAHFVVAGGVVFDPDARLDVRMVEVETSTIVRAIKENGRREDLVALTERIAERLVTDLELPERPATIAVQIPVDASFAYSRGLDYERRGRSDRAAAMFRRALELFPEHPHAAEALERVN